MSMSKRVQMTEEEIAAHLANEVEPILARHGAEILERKREFSAFLTIQYKGERLELHSSWLGRPGIKPVAYFFRHYDAVQSAVGQLAKAGDDVFHDHIHRIMKGVLPKNASVDDAQMIYSYLCDRVKGMGKRIHSD